MNDETDRDHTDVVRSSRKPEVLFPGKEAIRGAWPAKPMLGNLKFPPVRKRD